MYRFLLMQGRGPEGDFEVASFETMSDIWMNDIETYFQKVYDKFKVEEATIYCVDHNNKNCFGWTYAGISEILADYYQRKK